MAAISTALLFETVPRHRSPTSLNAVYFVSQSKDRTGVETFKLFFVLLEPNKAKLRLGVINRIRTGTNAVTGHHAAVTS
jgi:hypothetical protein